MMRTVALVAASALAILTVARPSEARAPMPCAVRANVDLTGRYDSKFGQVRLEQSGRRIVGTYDYDGGRLEGTIDGNVIRFAWTERSGAGRGVWVVASTSQLIGTWGTGDDDIGGGGWTLTPVARTVIAPP